MFASACATLYTRLRAYATLLKLGTVLLIVACAWASARLAVREDITSLMPTEPPSLAERFFLLREAPFMQAMTITVGKPDPGLNTAPTDPGELADTLANALRGADIPVVTTGSNTGFSLDVLTRLCDAIPALIPEARLRELPDLLTDEAVSQALQRDANLLISPRGLALRGLLAQDPLGICTSMLRTIGASARPAGLNTDSGHMVDASGRYALILAEPALPMSDAVAARAVMEKFQTAVKSLPEGTEVLLAGGHRHTEVNAQAVRNDLFRILPPSLALLALAFFAFVRSWRGLVIVLFPVSALAVASACTALISGSVSGIVLGFGSVLLGITSDYAIHVYYAVNAGRSVQESLRSIAQPLLLGALTTLSACAAFLFSSIPCIAQMGIFTACGITAALVGATVVLPHWLHPKAHGTVPPEPERPSAVLSRTAFRIRVPALAFAWCVLIAALLALFPRVPIDGDIRALSFVSESILHDETRTREIWGGLRESAMIVAKSETSSGGTSSGGPADWLDSALHINDRVWSVLNENLPGTTGSTPIRAMSLAPILPSPTTQHRRQQAWKQFWNIHADQALARLERLAPAAGFTPSAFTPFADWISREPSLLRADDLPSLGLELPARMLLRRLPDTVLAYTLLPGITELPPDILRAVENTGAWYVSGEVFRQELGHATRTDLTRFSALSLAVIAAVVLCAFRSSGRFTLVLLPVAAGLCAVLAVFYLSGQTLNIFHAVALPLIMALSVDYGIFMVAHLEGTLTRETRQAILFSGITTLSGFGCLLLARHPALFSLGITVSLGMGVALVTALCLLPLLVANKENGHV